MNTKKTILILDDDHVVRESLLAFFEDHNWQVIAAATGEEALEMTIKEEPDCVVVDIRLPGISGNEFILKAVEICPTMICIVCTGSPEYQLPYEIESFDNVCKRVFTKPLQDLGELQAQFLHEMKLLHKL